MILERREFLKLVGAAAGAASLGSCGRLLLPDRLVELALRGPGIETLENTICGLCEGGCGLTVRLVDGLPVGLKGNQRHPLNRGGLCPVGQAGLEVLYAPNRLQGPMRRQPDGSFQPTTWEAATSEIAQRLETLVAEGAGRRFAFFGGEPGSLFRDLARRFANALGSSSVAFEHDRQAIPFLLSQGIDQVPGFDLANSDLVLSVGIDLFADGAAPLHAISSLIGSRPTVDRATHLSIASRFSPTATKSAEHLAVAAGAHAAAALGIAHVLVREGRYDHRFVAEHTFGFDDWTDEQGARRLGFRRLLLERYYPDRAAALAGCEPGQLIRIARRLAAADSPIAICGGEAAAGSHATWTALAVHSLNALLGVFGRSGGVFLPPAIPFSPLTPLSTTPPPDEIFGSALGAGVPARDPVQSLAEAPAVDVLFLTGTNPVHDSPAGERLAEALAKIPLVVAFSAFADETASAADLILPPAFFLETFEESTTPPGAAISVLGVMRPVVEPFFDTRHPGDVLLTLARQLGGTVASAMPWESYETYLRDRIGGLVVSGKGSIISGSFEESWVHFLEERGWRFLEHDEDDEFWRDLIREGGWWAPVAESQDWERLFATRSGRFEFFSLELERRLRDLGRAADPADRATTLERGVEALNLAVPADMACLPHFEPASGAAELTLVPFRPITARGRTGVMSPMLLEMYGYSALAGWQTWIELAPETAHALHLDEGDRVELESERATMEGVVRIEPRAKAGCAYVPLGLGRRGTAGAADGIGANPMRLAAAGSDPISGSLATTGTAVEVRLVKRRARGGTRPLDGDHG